MTWIVFLQKESGTIGLTAASNDSNPMIPFSSHHQVLVAPSPSLLVLSVLVFAVLFLVLTVLFLVFSVLSLTFECAL
jgi:hypothetical protein